MNLEIERRSKVALVGDTDSGVYEFIQTLLGETYITEGEIKTRGNIVFLDASNSNFLVG
jgi:ABC-type polysaccharide/polyol phosphate transport system ATPase subunit